jgi:hypothetical protein
VYDTEVPRWGGQGTWIESYGARKLRATELETIRGHWSFLKRPRFSRTVVKTARMRLIENQCISEPLRAKMGLSVSLFATPYRCAGATAILGDCSDRSRDFGRGCANSWRIPCNTSESDPTNPRESRRLPRNGKALQIVTLRAPF